MPAGFTAAWSEHDDGARIRMRGADADRVVIRPRLSGTVATLPGMAGALSTDGHDLVFMPAYAFVEGAAYEVLVDGAVAVVLERPQLARVATAEVLSIHPASTSVPVNLLRLYVTFSRPMSDGQAERHIRLVDPAGSELPGVLLETEYELWDASHQRLTVLLDPGRIKQGLADHLSDGYPLRVGEPFLVVVDGGFSDATGAPLLRSAGRRYEVVGPASGRVRPESWRVGVPPAGSREPLTVAFGQPLDHGLVARCLEVVDASGLVLAGIRSIAADDASWSFSPADPWSAGEHAIHVDPVLEDIAGNSVTRVFDRDLATDADGTVVLSLPFVPAALTADYPQQS